MGDATRKELQALKKALGRILQEENPLPPPQQHAREAELSRRLSSTNGPSPAQALDSRDLSIMSRLLSQVRHLMECENEGEEVMQSEEVERSDFSDRHVETEKCMMEAVVEIASAAAEAAKAAAASSGKNVEVMETLLPHSEMHDEDGCSARALKDESSSRPIIDKNIVKRLERQNRITHWVLGFMIVATAIWRFKMLSMILGVRKSFANPFQALGDMVTEGLKGGTKEDQNTGGKGFHKAKTVLPSILGGEEKEVTKKTEKMEHSTTEDFKIGEAFTFSLDNLLSGGGTSDKHASEGVPEEGPSKE